MHIKTRLILSLFLATCLMIACSKDPVMKDAKVTTELKPVLPDEPYNYVGDAFPSFFFSPPLSFLNSVQSSNPITNNGTTLGRVLFYDKQLSKNNTISCGSCHHQDKGFSDPVSFSQGFAGGLTHRNSMSIVNTRFSYNFFWDLRATYVEGQVLMPIQNPVEMGMTLPELVDKVSKIDYYPALFQKAFGTTDITSDKIAKALAQFVQSLRSYRSKYDAGKVNGFADFTTIEIDGKNLFFGGTTKCNQCHATENFYDTQPLSNGLDSIYTDPGVYGITHDSADFGKFKTPSLRNVEVSAPYMHDGRFATLEDVVEHYNSGIQHNFNLDDRLTSTGTPGGTPQRLHLTGYQKASLVAFLKTLTDQSFLTDIRFSDPFK